MQWNRCMKNTYVILNFDFSWKGFVMSNRVENNIFDGRAEMAAVASAGLVTMTVVVVVQVFWEAHLERQSGLG